MGMIPAFLIVVIGLRGYLLKSDLAYLIGLVAATFFVNQVRLALMAFNHDGWLYWHEGDGKAIAAAMYAAIVFVAGYWATHSKRAAR